MVPNYLKQLCFQSININLNGIIISRNPRLLSLFVMLYSVSVLKTKQQQILSLALEQEFN